MSYAYVTLNLVDMWGEPRFNSERVSQLFFGSVVRFGQKENGYVHVAQEDGYSGWVNERFLKSISDQNAETYTDRLNAVITAKEVSTYTANGKSVDTPFFLYYGTKLYVKNWKSAMLKAELPDGTQIALKKSGVKPVPMKTSKVTAAKLIQNAKKFLGIGYLWGGISPAGFDCSGFMQTLFGRFGVALPRDTKDQIHVGSSVPRDGIKEGDLLFFDRHVGLAMGKELLIHASVGGGGVQISSLSANQPHYRADLDKSFREGRRVF
jgi:cell wall-associated NlpC family hydrolase